MAQPTLKTTTSKRYATFTDLPPELWDHIATYLPTASAVSALSRTNKSLYAFVEKDAWKSFARTHFPTLCAPDVPLSKHAARTLTSLSKAWDRRAFIATYVEPSHDITVFPGSKKATTWESPHGQTIGFTPLIDVYEDIEENWQHRTETLAFSAGAQICIRHTTRGGGGGSDVKWATYRPLAAREGQDDITTMHLLRPDDSLGDQRQHVITGTARGDLRLLGMPLDDPYDQDVRTTYFATQGMPVRSSSLLQEQSQPTLLATNLGDSRIALYNVDSEQSKICASSQFDLKPILRPDGNPSPNHRAWSTNFLSRTSLAVGAGPSENPIHVYPITESGLSRDGVRKLGLQNDPDGLDGKRSTSNVYTMVPLCADNGASGSGNVFLSGAYDGVVRLHDLRSNRDVEQAYVDPADDSAVYTILPRGQEKMLIGSSRHNLCKVFDLRLGARCYNYLDITQPRPGGSSAESADGDYNIFLRSSSPAFAVRGSRWNRNDHARALESSVYSLASPSAHSPYIYAGVESAIMSLSFTELLDRHPDPAYFQPWPANKSQNGNDHGADGKLVLNLAMYDQDSNMNLKVQRGYWETWRAAAPKGEFGVREQQIRLDERWRGPNSFGP